MNKQRSGALHLTQKVDYALILLLHLAKEKSSIKQIAEKRNLSFSFLQKIAQQLQQKDIIVSQRGKYGGYTLKKDPKKLYIKEVIEALEGPISIVPCLRPSLKKPQCYNKNCEILLGLRRVNQEIENFLGSKTLYQLSK
ncbi:MAG: Rrf2 family transcriptional regulator [Nitrospirota bacterium]